MSTTVEQSIDRWLSLQGIGKKERTKEYHSEISGIIKKHWPDPTTPLDQVTEAQCVTFASTIARYSAMRYNAIVYALRKIIPVAKCVPKKKYIAPERHIPTPEEFDRLVTALEQSHQGHAVLVVRFLAHSGLRINEATKLRWEHIREDHVYVPADATKNSLPRCVPFVEGMAEVITDLKRVRLTSTRPDNVLPQCDANNGIKYGCKLAGIPRVTHHTFRHYFATRCIQSGVDIPTVAKWLGHRDNGALLLRWYCHLLDEHSNEMAKRVKVCADAPEKIEVPGNVINLCATSS